MRITIDKELSDRVVELLHKLTEGKVNFIGERGVIISSSDPGRVGTIHEGGARIMAGEFDEMAITPAMAAEMKGANPGYNGAIRYQGELVGCLGLGGDPEQVRPLQKLASVIILDALEREDIRREEERSRREVIANIHAISENMLVLALNGSIQAAKLGNRGDAFKVVAGEMRKLAETINGMVDGMENAFKNSRTKFG